MQFAALGLSPCPYTGTCPWRLDHQLDLVTAGGEDLCPRRPPVLAARSHLEAVLAKPLDGALEVRDDDRGVAVGRDGRRLVAFEVDLGPAAFDPDEGLGECGWRLDPFESEQCPELE